MIIYNDIEQIKKAGFAGFKTIRELLNDCSVIPSTKGVYLVLNPTRNKGFLTKGTGGYFKGKEPNVSISKLESNWVDDAIVVYIGKADIRKKTGKGLNERIEEYLNFGQGKNNIGHYGGRLIWQLKNSADLVVCWKVLPDDDPEKIESGMIDEFKLQYGKLPFANLKRGKRKPKL